MRNRLLLVSMLVAAALATAVPLTTGEAASRELAQAASTEAPAPTRYSALSIVAPKKEQTIHDNTGKVPVEVALQPPLDTKAGHRLQAVVDGSVLSGSWTTTRFSLQQIDRGTHRLEVIVTDSAGKELARSAPVEFYVWQASRLFRQRSPQ